LLRYASKALLSEVVINSPLRNQPDFFFLLILPDLFFDPTYVTAPESLDFTSQLKILLNLAIIEYPEAVDYCHRVTYRIDYLIRFKVQVFIVPHGKD
jgi:hypothetical protein